VLTSGGRDGDFTFRCHRTSLTSHTKPPMTRMMVYALNAAAFHPSERPVMATAGSDGTFHFWDVAMRMRMKQFSMSGDAAITSCTFSADGDSFVYAVGEDWSKGCNGQNGVQPKLWMHQRVNGEIQRA
jgi:mRNA export factor